MAEDLGSEPHRPGGGPGVRVEQQLGRVAAHTRGQGRRGRWPGSRTPGRRPTPWTKPCQTPASYSGSGDLGLGAGVRRTGTAASRWPPPTTPRSWSHPGPAWRPAGSGCPGAPAPGRGRRWSWPGPAVDDPVEVGEGVDPVARPPADQVGDQPRPPRLVRGAEPGAVVAVEVLVEEQVVRSRRGRVGGGRPIRSRAAARPARRGTGRSAAGAGRRRPCRG